MGNSTNNAGALMSFIRKEWKSSYWKHLSLTCMFYLFILSFWREYVQILLGRGVLKPKCRQHTLLKALPAGRYLAIDNYRLSNSGRICETNRPTLRFRSKMKSKHV